MATTPFTEQGIERSYEIQFQGTISQRWLGWLGGMTIQAVDEDEKISLTTVEVRVPDQAALLGQLQKLHNLGYSLLQIKRMDESVS